MKIKTADFSNHILDKARVFATVAHAGQRRKYTNENYVVHPIECVAILQSLPASSGITLDQMIGMLLHDTIEDSRRYTDEHGNFITNPASHHHQGNSVYLVEVITLDMVEAEFGKEARRITAGLTDVSMPWDGSRSKRKAIDLAHTAEQANDVKTCKLADLLSNAPSIIENDTGFAKTWMKEKAALVEVLKDGGDPILVAEVQSILDQFFKA